MSTILGQINLFLSTAISASLVTWIAKLSPVMNTSASIVLLLVILTWVACFLADDWFCKRFRIELEVFRFLMIVIAGAIVTGLIIPQLPWLLGIG